jgi:protein-L-isoaspartate(D-aspartate) O-methyltransferase
MALIDELIREGYLRTPSIISAFRRIQRQDFIGPEEKDNYEINAPLPIGHGQTISQPLTVAFMLEALKPQPGDKVLDVGSGSGWTTALLAELVGEHGLVFALEIIPQLKEFGEKNIAKYGFNKKSRVEILLGDGHAGLAEHSPYDKILVSAAAPEPPGELLKQLAIGGRMVVPVGQWFDAQDIVTIEKIADHKFAEERHPGFVFVPLVKNQDNK